jgi:hypothetical protein
MTDRRKIAGTIVLAKAKHVLHASDAKRRYGQQWEVKVLEGVVVECTMEAKEGSTSGRRTTYITACYTTGSTTKTKKLTLLMVQEKPSDPVPAPPEAAINQQQPLIVVAPTTVNTTPTAVLPESTTIPTNNTVEDEEFNDTINQILVNNSHLQDDYSPFSRLSTYSEEETPVVTNHDQKWYDDRIAISDDINGVVPTKTWGIKTVLDDVYHEGSHRGCNDLSRMDVFKMMFPPAQMSLILRETNNQLLQRKLKLMTRQELFKLFGSLILLTRFEFASRNDLWSKKPQSPYEHAAGFGRFISRNRFNELTSALRFSHQPPIRQVHQPAERYRWMLVDDFVNNFNYHRYTKFIPSELICVDESMSRWYRQGGHWINIGLPHYLAIDRKPDNGCEIQTACCGKSGVMLQLRIVKTNKELQAQERLQSTAPITEDEEQQELQHGTKCLVALVKPWHHSQRLVCADSFFASVHTAETLLNIGLRFIGVVKTATKRFPWNYLNNVEMEKRGNRLGLISRDGHGVPRFLAFLFVDRERRYFIATAGSLANGTAINRMRWRQLADVESHADPERVLIEIPQPRAAEMYYSTCARIDQHNRDRTDTLQLDRKYETNDWSMRVNLTIFGMIIVDCWKIYSKLTFDIDDEGKRINNETQKQFYGRLAAELIDNQEGMAVGSATRVRQSEENLSPAIEKETGRPTSGIGPRITPTKKKRKNVDGTTSNSCWQGYCVVCHQKTTHVCSVCNDDTMVENEVFVCNTKRRARVSMCFHDHLRTQHDIYGEDGEV